MLPPWRDKSYGCDCRTSEGVRPTKREELTLEQIKAASDLLMPNKSYMSSDAFGRVVMAVASALAAQEARHQEQREVDAAAIRLSLGMLAVEEAGHKAEMEKYREELVQISVWLPNHGGIGATVLTQVQTAVLEAESKLRQATEALGEVAIPTLRYCERKFGIDDQARLNCEAAIRSGPAQPPAKMVMGGSYEVALAAAFEAVKVLADYPPEQETPKPRWKPCGASVDSSCSHGPASAPPAHGGGD